ncbi:MAG: M48 family metallopeptidase [Pyrinomonadaceae bacterium]
MKNIWRKHSLMAIALIWTMSVMPFLAIAQTRVNLGKNKYKVQDDVKIGRDAAKQVEQQMPILNDGQAQQYIERVGERLVMGIPRQFQQPAFDYTFKVVNARDINAFALPGGPMYVNRGMIEAAKNEGEMAGVMAHEISHVALRHATAQATKQGGIGNQLGTIGLILGGAILGGQTGAQIGAGVAQAWQTKYSREYETQADILGAQILADAGYDPRDLANMFQTIAQQGGGRGPEWLSSHPDPGNRYKKINDEAAMLNVSPNPIKVTREFSRVKERLAGMPRAQSMEEIAQAYKNSGGGQGSGEGGNNPMAGGRYSNRVEYPSTRLRTYNGNGIRVNVPSNWREFSQGSLTFTPDGGFGDQGITHGVMIGVYQSQNSGLANASRDYVSNMLQANQYLTQRNNLTRATVAGRQGYTTTLSGNSPVTNRTEVVTIFTLQLRSGDLLYIAAVVPEQESSRYNNTFRNMINSIQISD